MCSVHDDDKFDWNVLDWVYSHDCSSAVNHHAAHPGRHLALWHLSSQATVMSDGSLLSWRWLNSCLLIEGSEWIPCFAFLHMQSCFNIKLFNSQPTNFLIFTLPILCSIPPGEVVNKQVAVRGLSCWPWFNHNSRKRLHAFFCGTCLLLLLLLLFSHIPVLNYCLPQKKPKQNKT